MAERLNKQQTHKSDFHSETKIPLVLNQISTRLDASNKADLINPDDDLIASLQSRRENRRARQVFEWEMTRRGNGNPPNYYVAV